MVFVATTSVAIKLYIWSILPLCQINGIKYGEFGNMIYWTEAGEHDRPFWPQYWRHLRGIPEPDDSDEICRVDDGGWMSILLITLPLILGLLYKFRKSLVRSAAGRVGSADGTNKPKTGVISQTGSDEGHANSLLQTDQPRGGQQSSRWKLLKLGFVLMFACYGLFVSWLVPALLVLQETYDLKFRPFRFTQADSGLGYRPFWARYWRRLRHLPEPPNFDIDLEPFHTDDGGLILLAIISMIVVNLLAYKFRRHLIRRV